MEEHLDLHENEGASIHQESVELNVLDAVLVLHVLQPIVKVVARPISRICKYTTKTRHLDIAQPEGRGFNADLGTCETVVDIHSKTIHLEYIAKHKEVLGFNAKLSRSNMR